MLLALCSLPRHCYDTATAERPYAAVASTAQHHGGEVATLEAGLDCIAPGERPSLVVFHWAKQCFLHATPWPHGLPCHLEQHCGTDYGILHGANCWSHFRQSHLSFRAAAPCDPCWPHLSVHCGDIVFHE